MRGRKIRGFYTDDKKRVRPITTPSFTPRRIQVPQRPQSTNISYNVVKIPRPTWERIHDRMERLDMPEKISLGTQGFSANMDALVNTGFWFAAMDEPDIAEQLKNVKLDEHDRRINIIITDGSARYKWFGAYKSPEKIEEHEATHVKFDKLPIDVKEKMFQSIKSRKDYPILLNKLREHYGRAGEDEETILEEWYVRNAVDPLDVRIWLGAKAMPQKKQWKLIDENLR